MGNLDLTDAKMKNLNNLEDVAVRTLTQFLSDEREYDEKVSMAAKVANMVSKNRQTMTARECVRWTMIQEIGTEKQKCQYVAATQPEIQKVLTGKTDSPRGA